LDVGFEQELGKVQSEFEVVVWNQGMVGKVVQHQRVLGTMVSHYWELGRMVLRQGGFGVAESRQEILL
jgi:hypothetical protein